MTVRVHRIDQGTSAGKPVKLANGWLRVDALLTRTGVFTYYNADGSKRRELRLDEEVFSPAALKSFSLVPVTDEHPPEFLTAENTREYSRGSVGEAPTKDGQHVAAPLLVTDAELIAKLESGEAREISCGYTCDLEMTAGEHNGEKYDAIQRRIVGNHAAVVKRGRAGASARVRMDSAAVAVVRIDAEPGANPADPPQNQEQSVKIIRIDGVDFEVGSDAAAQAFAKFTARIDAERAELAGKIAAGEKTLATLQAKFDSATEENTKLKADVAALPAKLAGEAKVRAELETRARSVLGSKFDLSKLDAKGIRSTVLERLVKGIKLDGKAEAYLEARFDAELERFDAESKSDPTARARAEADPVNEDTGDDLPADSGDSFVRMVTDSQQTWEKTLNPSKS